MPPERPGRDPARRRAPAANGEGQRRPFLVGGEQYRTQIERAGGGGPKFNPFTPEAAQATLVPQVETLRQAVSELPSDLRTAHVIFETKLLANYLAGSYFPSEVVRAAGLDVVGSRNALGRLVTRDSEEIRPTKTLLLAGTDESFARLEELVKQDTTRGEARLWSNLIRVDEMRLTPAEEVVRTRPQGAGEGEVFTWEAVLHPVVSRGWAMAEREQREVLEKWEAVVTAAAGEVDLDLRRVVGGLTFIPVALPLEALPDVVRFNPLRCLRLMPVLRPLPHPTRRGVNGPFQLEAPPAGSTPSSSVRVAVFDGGVDDSCPFIAPFVRQVDLSPENPNPDDLLHGTAVTNAILYGYIREDGTVPRPDVYVDHFRVLPLPPQHGGGGDINSELYWLLDQIEREVRDGDYRIVNLSVGPRMAVDEEGEPDAWTSTLDQLAREKGVLFVTAGGNDGHLDPEAGLHRVQVPADMVNGLGVGACTTRDGRQIERASYSSQGPGRWGGRVQPAGVTFGGVLPVLPFVGILPQGRLGMMEGTSFAAPLAMHGLAGLLGEMGEPNVSPDLLRAFAIHLAQRSSRRHEVNEIGFGRFRERYDDVWIGSQNEVMVVYQDSLDRDGVAAFSLPVPIGIPNDATVALWWTLCLTLPIAPSDAVEYTQAGCEILFRPHRYRYSFTNSQTNARMGELDVRTEAAQALAYIQAGGVMSALPVSKSVKRVSGNEQGLRESGKWESVIQQRFARLEAATLVEPTLELKYVARSGGMLARDVEALRFSLLVSARVRENINLYELVTQQFPLLTTIDLQGRIRV